MAGKIKHPAVLVFCLCVAACVAALLSVVVRLPSAEPYGASNKERTAYTTDTGTPYFTDQDSYYHVRLVQNHMTSGVFGDTVVDGQTSWDTKSFWPEGRSAAYPPGIVWLTEAAWGVLHAYAGVSLERMEFCIPVLASSLVALVGFVLGMRVNGGVCGLVVGVLVSCAPGFVLRSVFGRYDTDALIVLLDVLLVLMLTEALRAQTLRKKALLFGGFLFVAWTYGLCWTPQNVALYVAMLLVGALLYVLLVAWNRRTKGLGAIDAVTTSGVNLALVVLCVIVAVVAGFVVYGPHFVSQAVRAVAGTVDLGASSAMPSMFTSVSELRAPALSPEVGLRWLVGDMLRSDATILEGLGGVVVCLFAAVGLLALVSCARDRKATNTPLDPNACRIYLCVIGVQLVGGCYLSLRGIRFIEHLAVPVGVLAGVGVGWAAQLIRAHLHPKDHVCRVLAGALCTVVCTMAIAPSLLGSYAISARTRPSASDAHAHAMQWVRNHALDANAVVVTWWDMGYFYEFESGHPCLWDGGTLNGTRAMLLAKALVAQDPQFSVAMLRMLSASGNRAVDRLMGHVDASMAFSAVCDALLLGEDETRSLLVERCGLTRDEASEVELLVHPRASQEVYLVLSNEMLLRLGWYEYYADWDFSGEATPPRATAFNKAWDGTPLQDSEEGKELLQRRSGETMWRLLVDGKVDGAFARVFDEDDGVSHVRVWRIA